MNWLKHVVIDIAALAVIAIFTFAGGTWAWWVIAVYTPLLVVLKVLALSMGVSSAVKKKGGDEAPDWFFHLVYALSVLLLLQAQEYMFAGGWALIWMLSAIGQARSRPSKKK